MKREYQDASGSSAGGGGDMGSSKDKMMVAAAGEEEEVDELASLWYKVRSSDMVDVTQKLEQLEMDVTQNL